MPLLTVLALGGVAASLFGVAKKATKNRKKKHKHTSTDNIVKQKTVLSPAEAKYAQQQKVALGLFGLNTLMVSHVVTVAGLSLLGYNFFYFLWEIRESYLKKKQV